MSSLLVATFAIVCIQPWCECKPENWCRITAPQPPRLMWALAHNSAPCNEWGVFPSLPLCGSTSPVQLRTG